MNHYPKHIGDFAAATQGLSLTERGAYEALLDQYYVHEAPLPLDRREVYRMAVTTTSAERKAVDYVLTRYFREEGDGWHQKRADAEIAAYREKAAKASASASIRWSGRNANASPRPTPDAMRTHSEGNANQNQNQNQNQEGQERSGEKPPPKRSKRPPDTPMPSDFAISDRVRAWAAKKGIERLDEHLESFRSKCLAKGYTYADWDQAFENAVRDDWAGINGKRAPPSLAERRANTVDNIINGTTGKAHERTIEGIAERVDREAPDALPIDVREQGRHRLRNSG
jgi:uncharacterized protein YdaU (DUF1376 family)